ncbi:MAG TPA: c-type cytochrome [Gaiellaceae bacterium]|nr:c-type cytochrome [Gaiellaceae bacterium]
MPAELRALVALVAALVAVPVAAAAPGVKQGEHLYGRYCVSCHGMNGSGVQPARRIGAGPGRAQTQQHAVAPPLRGVGARAADFYLRTGYMPLQKIGLQPRRSTVIFDEQQLRSLIAYVASLGGGPPIPQPHPERGNLSLGQHLFTDNCAGCHQVVAEGGYVTGAVPPALENATAVQVAEAVRIGPNVMPTFSRKQISAHELDSIIRYVEYTKNPDDRGGWAIGHIGPLPEGLVTWFIAALALVFTCLMIGKRLHGE